MENYMFDFDGTLADSGETAVLATQATFKDFGLSLPSSDQIRGYMGIPIEKSFPLMGLRLICPQCLPAFGSIIRRWKLARSNYILGSRKF